MGMDIIHGLLGIHMLYVINVVFKGGYQNNMKHGYGEFTFANKGIYKGNWVNGK